LTKYNRRLEILVKNLAGGRDRIKEREGVSCSFIDKALGPEFVVEF